MTTKYAEGTKVSVETSRGEITGILAKHGVVRMAWGSEPEGDTLQFEIQGASYRFFIPKPTLEEVRTAYIAAGGRWNLVYDEEAKVVAEWRRRWRAHVLLLKAKLEFAASGDSTLTRELMPYLLLRDGRTLEAAISNGGVPLLEAGAKR